MTYNFEQSDEGVVLSLDGECTIEHAAPLKDVLQQAMHMGSEILLQLRGVTAVDVSFLQLLCAAHRRSVELDKHLAMDPCWSESLKDLARNAGYYRKVGCHKDPTRECLWQGGYSE
jgi:ABC-type transporter Mla MlaB component